MELRVLGPLEVVDDGAPLPLGRGRERTVLALLTVRRNEVVPLEILVDELWPDDPPATARKVVQNAVSRLREVLGRDRIERAGRGYKLRIAPGELDVEAFERLAREAREAVAGGDTAGASATLSRALALWRGTPYGDVAHEQGLRPEILRLEEQRLALLEDRFEAELRLGQHAAVVPELESLVEQHPLRERLRGELMLALYRCGRQADALDTYRRGRRALVDELGLEPGPTLRHLERAILAQEASLDLAAESERTPVPAAAADPRQPQEERKLVSVLFVDAVGLVAQLDSDDPEDVLARLQPYHAVVREEVTRLGGAVDRVVGPTVMAVFGVPRAHEDDAERAVRAALAIVDRLDLDARAAVETGEALVDLARADVGETVLAGEVVTRAALLREDVPVRRVVVGERSRQAARAALELEDAPDLAVAGASAPVRRWLVRGLGGSVPAIRAPFTGRGVELALLEQAFARTLQEATVQLVTITGQPGIGKTRLVAELRTLLEPQPAVWRQGRCLPYGEGVTFWALGEIVKGQAGIVESDDPEQAASKLEASAALVLGDSAQRDWIVSSLAPLVGATSTSQVGADERLETSFTAWRRFLEAIAAHDPLVLVFEDIQWADPAFLDFLDDLAETGPPVPILVLCTARSELYDIRPGWGGGKRNSTAMALAPLSEQETGRLVAALLAEAVLPAEVHDALLERSQGNPLYAEEFVRMLDDRGILARRGRSSVIAPGAEIPVPESIQAVIAARLDMLEPEQKSLLQDAAVVGRVFWPGAVASMQGTDEAMVEDVLRELARRELVHMPRASSTGDVTEYAFWHALVRDVAYGQIPRAARARKHEEAAEWIEQLVGARVTDHAEFLAHHYVRSLELRAAAGGDPAPAVEERAFRFLVLAGDRALQLDVSRAESSYRRALELLSLDDERRPRVLAKIAEAAWLAGRLSEAERAYEEVVPAFEAQGDFLRAGEALVGLVQSLRDHGETERSRRLLAQAMEVLEREPPGRELTLAYLHRARDAMLDVRPGECLEASEHAIALCRMLGLDHHLARVLQFRGFARVETGDLGGLEDLRESLGRCLELGLGYYTVNAYGNLGDALRDVGGPAEALALKRAGVAFGDERGIVFKARWLEAETLWALADLGRWDEVLEVAERLAHWDDAYGGSQIGVIARVSTADVLARRGAVEQARAIVDTVLPRTRSIGDPQVLAPALVVAALCSRDEHRSEEVRAHLEELGGVTSRSPTQASVLLPDAARLATTIGAPDLVEELTARTRLAPGKRVEAAVHTADALAAESARRHEEASRLFSLAAAMWTSCACIHEVGQAQLGAGRCLVSLGRQEDAQRLLEAARSIFGDLGAARLVEEARALLESARAPVQHDTA